MRGEQRLRREVALRTDCLNYETGTRAHPRDTCLHKSRCSCLAQARSTIEYMRIKPKKIKRGVMV